MKATIEVPDALYRRVKAKTALQGRAIREVTIELSSNGSKGSRISRGAPRVGPEGQRYTTASAHTAGWSGAGRRLRGPSLSVRE